MKGHCIRTKDGRTQEELLYVCGIIFGIVIRKELERSIRCLTFLISSNVYILDKKKAEHIQLCYLVKSSGELQPSLCGGLGG